MHKGHARLLIGIATVLSVAIFSVALFVPGISGYIPTSDIDKREPNIIQQAIDSQSEAYCVALAVYFEGGSTFESEEGQRHIARVVVERGKANLRKWGGTNLCDVVFYKRGAVCQFSFACLPMARRTPARRARLWEHALQIAKEEIEGQSDVTEFDIRYYMNPIADLGPKRLPFPQGVRAGRGIRTAPVLPRADRGGTRGARQERSDRMPALQGGTRGKEARREARRAEAEVAVSRGAREEEDQEDPRRRAVTAFVRWAIPGVRDRN